MPAAITHMRELLGIATASTTQVPGGKFRQIPNASKKLLDAQLTKRRIRSSVD
jgi:hypothetical protein